MTRDKRKIGTSLLVFRIIYKYEPLYLVWSSLHIVISPLLTLLYIYAPKLILEAVTNKKPFSYTVRIVIIYGIILLILNLLKTFFENRKSKAAIHFARTIHREVGKITMQIELSKLENASTIQTINLAKNATNITVVASYFSNILSSIITIIGLAYIITKLDVWCIASIIVITILKFVISYSQSLYLKTYRKLEAQNNRVGNYVTGLAYFNPGAAKEIRVNALQQWILKKIKSFRNNMVALQYKNFKRTALFDSIISIAVMLQSLVILVIMSLKYTKGQITIADFTMIFSAVTSLTVSLSSLGEQINNYRQQANVAADYEKLLEFGEETTEITEKSNSIGNIEEIEFKNISFSYPESEIKVLDRVNLKIKKGEKLVIVGLNGSGKTTLIKLLCKFYRPTNGQITINGCDIWDIPNNEYYKLITAVFQDYTNFAFTISENVCLDNDINQKRVEMLLKNLGIKFYDKAADTFVTKIFSSNGIDLSGGEGQKIAIARAVMKKSQVLILDEPTASLDVKAETDIYNEFFKLSEDKTTIFISHRLSCVCVADNIAVFEKGTLVEYGSHKDLINEQGLYSEMYNKQSQLYLK